MCHLLLAIPGDQLFGFLHEEQIECYSPSRVYYAVCIKPNICILTIIYCITYWYRGADMSLAGPGRKQATATENFEFHVSYL